MADLTNLFAKIKIYGMKKGAAAPIKSLRLVVLYCNDSYIQLYFWCIRPGYPVIHPVSR